MSERIGNLKRKLTTQRKKSEMYCSLLSESCERDEADRFVRMDSLRDVLSKIPDKVSVLSLSQLYVWRINV